MIDYAKRPCCYRCYWRNVFSHIDPQDVYFVNNDNTNLYFIIKQNNVYDIIDMTHAEMQQTGMDLNSLLDFLTKFQCMPVDIDINAVWKYTKDYDNCNCDCCTNINHTN